MNLGLLVQVLLLMDMAVAAVPRPPVCVESSMMGRDNVTLLLSNTNGPRPAYLMNLYAGSYCPAGSPMLMVLLTHTNPSSLLAALSVTRNREGEGPLVSKML